VYQSFLVFRLGLLIARSGASHGRSTVSPLVRSHAAYTTN
jgi:hypothetical protein